MIIQIFHFLHVIHLRFKSSLFTLKKVCDRVCEVTKSSLTDWEQSTPRSSAFQSSAIANPESRLALDLNGGSSTSCKQTLFSGKWYYNTTQFYHYLKENIQTDTIRINCTLKNMICDKKVSAYIKVNLN